MHALAWRSTRIPCGHVSDGRVRRVGLLLTLVEAS